MLLTVRYCQTVINQWREQNGKCLYWAAVDTIECLEFKTLECYSACHKITDSIYMYRTRSFHYFNGLLWLLSRCCKDKEVYSIVSLWCLVWLLLILFKRLFWLRKLHGIKGGDFLCLSKLWYMITDSAIFYWECAYAGKKK